MKTQLKIIISLLVILIALVATLVAVLSPSPKKIELAVDSSNGVIAKTSGGWNIMMNGAGYARLTYPIPEKTGSAWSSFYGKVDFVLPENYKISGRIMTTDNYTSLGFGAKDSNELRCGVWIYQGDNNVHVRCEHETFAASAFELWVSPEPLSAGRHVIEFYGNMGQAGPWYVRVDGSTVAEGNRKLCMPELLQTECVVTRMRAGLDGATLGSILIKSFSVDSNDPNGN